MPNKTKVYVAVAVALALTGTVTVSLPAAVASTTACGSACTSPSNESSGEVLTVSGSSVVMAAASTTNSAQDWTVEDEYGVPNAVSAGVVSAKLNMNYSDSELVEFQYAPDGVPSDKCMGDTPAVNSGSAFYNPTLTVGLVQCGVTAASLWLIDQNGALDVYDDLINAGYEVGYTYLAPNTGYSVYAGDFPLNNQNPVTSPFAEPAVLTVSSGSSGSTVGLAPLSEIGGVVSPSQAWTAYTAPDQSALRAAIKKSAKKSSG